MKNIYKLIAMMLCVVIVISCMSSYGVSAATVTLNKSKVTLEKDAYIKLKLDGTTEKVKWSSKNKKIAKVSSTGKVTAVAEGTTTITATLNGKKYNCTVNVVDSNKQEVKKEKIVEGTTTIKEKVLYSKNDIKITVTGFEKNMWGNYVAKLQVENKTGESIDYSVANVKINGFSFVNTGFGTIYDGKKATVEIGAEERALNVAGIAHVMEIEAELEFSYTDTDEEIDVAKLDIQTSDYGKYKQNHDLSGMEIYNRNGVRVLVIKVEKPTDTHPFALFVENSTDKRVNLSYDDVAINDEMVASMISGFVVAPNSYAMTEATFYLYGVDIDQVESVDFTLSVIPYRFNGGFSTADIDNADPVTITY